MAMGIDDVIGLWWVEARDISECPSKVLTSDIPARKNHLSLNISSVETGKLWSRLYLL
jgi:hypothetical protein